MQRNPFELLGLSLDWIADHPNEKINDDDFLMARKWRGDFDQLSGMSQKNILEEIINSDPLR